MKFSKMNSKFIFMISRIVIRVNETNNVFKRYLMMIAFHRAFTLGMH